MIVDEAACRGCVPTATRPRSLLPATLGLTFVVPNPNRRGLPTRAPPPFVSVPPGTILVVRFRTQVPVPTGALPGSIMTVAFPPPTAPGGVVTAQPVRARARVRFDAAVTSKRDSFTCATSFIDERSRFPATLRARARDRRWWHVCSSGCVSQKGRVHHDRTSHGRFVQVLAHASPHRIISI